MSYWWRNGGWLRLYLSARPSIRVLTVSVCSCQSHWPSGRRENTRATLSITCCFHCALSNNKRIVCSGHTRTRSSCERTIVPRHAGTVGSTAGWVLGRDGTRAGTRGGTRVGPGGGRGRGGGNGGERRRRGREEGELRGVTSGEFWCD